MTRNADGVAADTGLRPLQVLVVEDSLMLQRLLSFSLTEADPKLSLEAALSLAGALDRLKAGGIDVVLLDLFLPDATEVKAITAIRLANPSVPIVVMTGVGIDLEKASMDAGANEFIAKDTAMKPALVASVLRRASEQKIRENHERISRSLDDTSEAIKDFDKLDGARQRESETDTA